MPVAMTPSVDWRNEPLTLTAKVDTVTAPSHALFWECEFVPALESDGLADSITFDGVDGTNASSNRPFEGRWTVSADSGDFDATHTVEVVLLDADLNPTGAPLATLSAAGEFAVILMPYSLKQQRVRIWQPLMPFAATLSLTRTENYITQGQEPIVTVNGNQLNVIYDALPMRGLFTAHAAIYDDTGALLVASDPITLNIRE